MCHGKYEEIIGDIYVIHNSTDAMTLYIFFNDIAVL